MGCGGGGGLPIRPSAPEETGRTVFCVKFQKHEDRLNLGTAEAQQFLIEQMDNYFFGEGAALPPDFVPMKSKG